MTTYFCIGKTCKIQLNWVLVLASLTCISILTSNLRVGNKIFSLKYDEDQAKDRKQQT